MIAIVFYIRPVSTDSDDKTKHSDVGASCKGMTGLLISLRKYFEKGPCKEGTAVSLDLDK